MFEQSKLTDQERAIKKRDKLIATINGHEEKLINSLKQVEKRRKQITDRKAELDVILKQIAHHDAMVAKLREEKAIADKKKLNKKKRKRESKNSPKQRRATKKKKNSPNAADDTLTPST